MVTEQLAVQTRREFSHPNYVNHPRADVVVLVVPGNFLHLPLLPKRQCFDAPQQRQPCLASGHRIYNMLYVPHLAGSPYDDERMAYYKLL